MTRRQRAGLSIGIFAEGPEPTAPREQQEAFDALWRGLCNRLSGAVGKLFVYGFSKAQILALDASSVVLGASREPLDVLVERMYRRDGFENAVIAFDRFPVNTLVPHSCLRSEVNFILQHFKRRKLLPPHIQEEVSSLLRRYSLYPEQPRGPGRPPRGPLDFVYMDPEFEALLTFDEPTVCRTLGVDHKPKDWPSFRRQTRNPGLHILNPALVFASEEVRRKVRGTMKTNKHGWAAWIIGQAGDESRLFQHEIALRLQTILA